MTARQRRSGEALFETIEAQEKSPVLPTELKQDQCDRDERETFKN